MLAAATAATATAAAAAAAVAAVAVTLAVAAAAAAAAAAEPTSHFGKVAIAAAPATTVAGPLWLMAIRIRDESGVKKSGLVNLKTWIRTESSPGDFLSCSPRGVVMLSLLCALTALNAPLVARPALLTPALRAPVPTMIADAFLPLDSIEPAVSSYVGIWTPLFEQAKAAGLAPDFLLHWGHGAAMSTVLLTMGGYGAFLGWQTRLGNGGEVCALSLGETARELHPKIMGLALFFFLLGGQGGLVLLATAGKPILQSAHSSTAIIGLGLMAAQASIGSLMGSNDAARAAHAYLGSATLLALCVHAYFGLNLGLSF